MIDGLGCKDRFDKRCPLRRCSIPGIPSLNFRDHFIFELLKISSPETPHRRWQPKVFDREGWPFHRRTVKDIININLSTRNWHHEALLKVSAKAGDLIEVMENGGKVLDVLFDGGQKKRAVSSAYRDVLKVALRPLIL
jgi:hypothetical protein